jgi:hypothetical protein
MVEFAGKKAAGGLFGPSPSIENDSAAIRRQGKASGKRDPGLASTKEHYKAVEQEG